MKPVELSGVQRVIVQIMKLFFSRTLIVGYIRIPYMITVDRYAAYPNVFPQKPQELYPGSQEDQVPDNLDRRNDCFIGFIKTF